MMRRTPGGGDLLQIDNKKDIVLLEGLGGQNVPNLYDTIYEGSLMDH
jgi:hypothetical protein